MDLRIVHTGCGAFQCGAVRCVAVCGKNDATCRTMLHRNAPQHVRCERTFNDKIVEQERSTDHIHLPFNTTKQYTLENTYIKCTKRYTIMCSKVKDAMADTLWGPPSSLKITCPFVIRLIGSGRDRFLDNTVAIKLCNN